VARRFKRRIWIGRLNRRRHSLFDSAFAEDLLAALDPTLTVERHDRRWRLSKPELQSGFICGKLGFERLSSEEAVSYDEEALDFVVETGPAQQGNFSQFVVSLSSQRVAFEQKGNEIRRQSFRGAMNKILADSGFQLDFLLDEESFEVWLDDVDVVTRFTAKLRPPNPSPRARAEEINKLLIAEPESEETQVVMKSRRGLRAKNTAIIGIAEHAGEGHADFSATALKKGALKFFDSTRRLLQAAMEVADDEDEDSIWRKLRDVVGKNEKVGTGTKSRE
jgi:hypothetical protein